MYFVGRQNVRFNARLFVFQNKRATDAERRAIGCKMDWDFIDRFVVHPDSRRALDYAKTMTDRNRATKEATKIRRDAKLVTHPIYWANSEEQKQTYIRDFYAAHGQEICFEACLNAASACEQLMWHPFPFSQLDRVKCSVVGCLVNNARQNKLIGDDESSRKSFEEEVHARLVQWLEPVMPVSRDRLSSAPTNLVQPEAYVFEVLNQYAHVVDYAREYLHFAEDFTDAMQAKLRIIEAWDLVAKMEGITSVDLVPFAKVAHHKTDSVARDAIVLLLIFGFVHAEARDCLMELMRDKSGVVRWRAVSSIAYYFPRTYPREFIDEYFRLALGDKSSKVRMRAAESAIEYQRKDLLPEIERILVSEASPRIASYYEGAIRMLSNGYLTRIDESGHTWLTFKTPNSTVNIRLEPEQCSEVAIRRIIAEKVAADPLPNTDLLRASCWTEASFTVAPSQTT